MKSSKFLIIFIFISIIFLTFTYRHAFADLYFPSPDHNCRADEIYKKTTELNDKENYSKIRNTIFNTSYFSSNYGEKGYCINVDEYCTKNKCDPITNITRINSIYFHLNNLFINFFFNSLLVLILYLFSKTGISKFLQLSVLIKIIIITIFGYIADFLGVIIGSSVVSMGCSFDQKFGSLCSGIWYKSSYLAKIISPLSLIIITISILVTFILITTVFYKTFSSNITINKKQRLIYSIFFGLLSNPIWYILYKFFV